jgi:hypothetical protein
MRSSKLLVDYTEERCTSDQMSLSGTLVRNRLAELATRVDDGRPTVSYDGECICCLPHIAGG